MKQEIKRVLAGTVFLLLINIPGLYIWDYHNYQATEFIPCMLVGGVTTAFVSLLLGLFVFFVGKIGKDLIG